MGKSAAANWAGRWTRRVPDRANDPKRRPSISKDDWGMSSKNASESERVNRGTRQPSTAKPVEDKPDLLEW